jgi:hypothetical protein
MRASWIVFVRTNDCIFPHLNLPRRFKYYGFVNMSILPMHFKDFDRYVHS